MYISVFILKTSIYVQFITYTACITVIVVRSCDFEINCMLSIVILATPEPPIFSRPCDPSPCGINAYCHERFDTAICECIPNYRGNPYQGCQPECLVNTDCPKSQACIRTRCQDPCPGTCGVGAICTVSNHVPICSCPLPTIGDAFTLCQIPVEGTISLFLYHRHFFHCIFSSEKFSTSCNKRHKI